MRFLHLIWCNFKRKKLRTALTLLSIMVAFLLFGLLAAIKHALTGGISIEGQSRLVVRNKVSLILPLPQSYQARMERIPGVAGVAHLTWFGGYFQDPKNFFMQSPVVPDEFLPMYPEIGLPADQRKVWEQTRTGAIVGRATADKFHWKLGDKIPIFSTIYRKADGSSVWEFDLVGIFDPKTKDTDTTSLYFRYDYFDEARAFGRGRVGWYAIRLADPSRAAEVASKVDREFENSDAETKTEPEKAFAQAFANQIGNIALLTATILAAVFFAILLVTGNTMSQAIRERMGELGVLKAIGFTNSQTLGIVLAESCLLAVIGGVLGLGSAWLFISHGDPTGMLPLFSFPIPDLLFGFGLSLALGLATGIVPALAAMRLRVADALRRL